MTRWTTALPAAGAAAAARTMLAALVAMVSLGSTGPALAQSRGGPPAPANAAPVVAPALSEVSRAPYQEYVPFASPGGPPYKLDFTPVPGRSRLDVSNVSCYIASQYGQYNGPDIMYVQLLVLDASDALVSASTLTPIRVASEPLHSPDAGITWAVNNTVSVFAPARHRFQVLLGPSPGNFAYVRLACHISGQMVKLG
jgi:hypothetical protein